MQDAIDFNLDDLTLDEAEELEDITGKTLAEMTESLSVKTLKAFVFISMRRTNPDITMDEVGKLAVSTLGNDQSAPTDS